MEEPIKSGQQAINLLTKTEFHLNPIYLMLSSLVTGTCWDSAKIYVTNEHRPVTLPKFPPTSSASILVPHMNHRPWW